MKKFVTIACLVLVATFMMTVDRVEATDYNCIDASDYASLSLAITAAQGKELIISNNQNIGTTDVNITGCASVRVLGSGTFTKNSTGRLTISDPFYAPLKKQVFISFAVGDVTLGCPVNPIWFSESGVGSETVPFVVDFNVVDSATSTQEWGTVYLIGDYHYKIKTAPWTMTYVQRLFSVGGMGFIKNETPGADAIVTPEVVTPSTSYSDYLVIKDVTVWGVRVGGGTGRGIYLQDATRWRLENVISRNHGSHGLEVRGSSWIGNIYGGFYQNNGGDGIRIVTESGGAPNGISLYGVDCEGNGGWGIRIGDDLVTQYTDTINIYGGVNESNTAGAIRADYVTTLNLDGIHFEGDPFSFGTTGNVHNLSIRNCFGLNGVTIGSGVTNFTLDGGRTYASGQAILTNTRGNVKIRNWGAQAQPGTTLYIKETCPNAPTYYSLLNTGLKGPGSILGNGGFFQREDGETAAPSGWALQNATITYDNIGDLNPNSYGKVAVITTTADGGNLNQGFGFHRNPDHLFYASAWIRVVSGIGVFEITDGNRTWSVETTDTNWHRITIPFAISADVSSGSIRLKGRSGTIVRFAEVQIVRDMDILGYRCYDSYDARLLLAKFTWDPPSISSRTSATTTVTVTGATIGQSVNLYPPYDLQGLTATAYVSAANTVKVVLANVTASSVNLANSTDWKVGVIR